MKDKYTMLEDIATLVRFTVFVDDPLIYKVGMCVSEPVDDDFDYGGGIFTCTGANFNNEDDVVTYIVNEIGKEVL